MEHTNLLAYLDSLGSAPFPGESLLRHSSFQDSSKALTHFQSQVDGLVSSFLRQSTDAAALASLVAGGMAYRWGRIGAMSLEFKIFEPFRRLVSRGIGLGAEVSAFEFTNRSLHFKTANLWRWEGVGGIRQGLLTSLITFSSLKSAGGLAQGENLVVQHLLQDSAMVLGHQAAGFFGLTSRPEGTLPEQLLHAEAVNLQMKGGLALLQRGLPRLESIEKSLDLHLRTSSSSKGPLPLLPSLQPAYTGRSIPEGSGEKPFEGIVDYFHDEKPEERIYLSEGNSEGGGGSVKGEREAFRNRLEKKYGAMLSVVFPPLLVSDAISTALDFPPSLKAYRREFLTAFSHLGDRDSLSVHLTLLAIREILLLDALHTSKGSYLDAYAQLFLTSALSDRDGGRRSFAFRAL